MSDIKWLRIAVGALIMLASGIWTWWSLAGGGFSAWLLPPGAAALIGVLLLIDGLAAGRFSEAVEDAFRRQSQSNEQHVSVVIELGCLTGMSGYTSSSGTEVGKLLDTVTGHSHAQWKEHYAVHTHYIDAPRKGSREVRETCRSCGASVELTVSSNFLVGGHQATAFDHKHKVLSAKSEAENTLPTPQESAVALGLLALLCVAIWFDWGFVSNWIADSKAQREREVAAVAAREQARTETAKREIVKDQVAAQALAKDLIKFFSAGGTLCLTLHSAEPAVEEQASLISTPGTAAGSASVAFSRRVLILGPRNLLEAKKTVPLWGPSAPPGQNWDAAIEALELLQGSEMQRRALYREFADAIASENVQAALVEYSSEPEVSNTSMGGGGAATASGPSLGRMPAGGGAAGAVQISSTLDAAAGAIGSDAGNGGQAATSLESVPLAKAVLLSRDKFLEILSSEFAISIEEARPSDSDGLMP